MSTAIESTESKIERSAGEVAHVRALLEALGNPSEWSYTGEVSDALAPVAKCACGHAIRFCFHIEHPAGRRAQVGSTCIDQIACISPELGQRLLAARAELEAKLSALKSQAKRAAANERNAALWAEYSALRDDRISTAKAMRLNGQRVSSELYFFAFSGVCRHRRMKCPEYVNPGTLRKWIEAAIAFTKGVPNY